MLKLIFSIIFFVSSLAGGLYVVYPLYEDYQRRLEEREVLKEELENLVVYIEDLRKIERKIEENREEFAVLETAFPEDHDAPPFFLYLQTRMEENNLNPEGAFGSFSVSEYSYNETDHGRIREVGFEISLTGSYENLKNFFKETEELIRIISINEVSISQDPFGMGEIRVNVDASTYSY